MLSILRREGFGFALWSYKQMDFGVVGADGEVVDQAYLDALLDA